MVMVSERQTVPNSRTSPLKCQVVSLFVGRILFFSALGSMELAFSELNEPDLSVYQVYNLKNSLGQLTREPFCRLSVVQQRSETTGAHWITTLLFVLPCTTSCACNPRREASQREAERCRLHLRRTARLDNCVLDLHSSYDHQLDPRRGGGALFSRKLIQHVY